MGFDILLSIILKFFEVLAWPPFTVVCPLFASIRAIESNTESNYQQCLTFWILFSVATILEPMLAKLLVWFPFWSYVKGIATFFLVVSYFQGAAYVYLRFIRHHVLWNSQICDLLFSPETKACTLSEQNDILDSAKSFLLENGEEEMEKFVIHEGEPKIPESTTSLGNLNQIKLVNLNNLSSLLTPFARSFGLCRWVKPGFGWTKLNADGSVGRDGASFGGLLRDYNGDAICAYASKAHGDDIFLVELWAVWRGLVLASKLGVNSIWVESDAMSVVKTINKEQPCGPRASSCFKHIQRLLKTFEMYKVSHSWRETNRAADQLSKMDLAGSDVVLWPVDFPDSLRKIIKEDAQGRWYRRVC